MIKCVFLELIFGISRKRRLQHFHSKHVSDRDHLPLPVAGVGGSVSLARAPAGNYRKVADVLIVLWECSWPLSSEFYQKRHLMDDPQCKMNPFPESWTNCPQGFKDRAVR